MAKQVTILWLMCLFAWNSLFGVFGGVILCLHESLDFHVDVEKKASSDCCPQTHEPSQPLTPHEDHVACVDLVLEGNEIPPLRNNEVEEILLPELTLFAIVEWPVLNVHGLCTDSITSHLSRAPPLTEWSALTVTRTTYLRL